MNKRNHVFLALSVCLAVSGCSTTPVDSSGASSKNGIPAGMYVGDMTCEQTLYLLSDPEGTRETTQRSSPDIIAEFGSGGMVLTAQGTPIEPGDAKETDLGIVEGTSVVQSTSVGIDQASILWDEQLVIPDLGGARVELVGSKQELYQSQSPGVVLLKTEETAGGDVIGEDQEILDHMVFQTSCTAELAL